MFFGNTKINNKKNILKTYLINSQQGPFFTYNWSDYDVNVNNNVNNDIIFTNKRTHINWSKIFDNRTNNNSYIAVIEFKDEIGSVTVVSSIDDTSSRFYKFSDDGKNWIPNTNTDLTKDDGLRTHYTYGHTFKADKNSRYFMISGTNNNPLTIEINPIIPNTYWIAPSISSLFKTAYAIKDNNISNKITNNMDNVGAIYSINNHSNLTEYWSKIADDNKNSNSFKGKNFFVNGNFMAVPYKGTENTPSFVRCFVKKEFADIQKLNVYNDWVQLGQDIECRLDNGKIWNGHISVTSAYYDTWQNINLFYSSVKSATIDIRTIQNGKFGLKIIIGCPFSNVPTNFMKNITSFNKENDVIKHSDANDMERGRVFIYEYNYLKFIWELDDTLYPRDTYSSSQFNILVNDPRREEFGYSVKLSYNGERLFVGSPLWTQPKGSLFEYCGKITVYDLNTNNYKYEFKAIINDPDYAVSKDMYGAWLHGGAGASYNWNSVPYLQDSNYADYETNDNSGTFLRGVGRNFSINIDGIGLVASSAFNKRFNTGEGKIFIYHRNSSTENWDTSWVFNPSVSAQNSKLFGFTVAMKPTHTNTEGIIVVGSPYLSNNKGQIDLYSYNGTNWKHLIMMTEPTAHVETTTQLTGNNENDFFGWSIYYGGRVYVGAPRFKNTSTSTIKPYVKYFNTEGFYSIGDRRPLFSALYDENGTNNYTILPTLTEITTINKNSDSIGFQDRFGEYITGSELYLYIGSPGKDISDVNLLIEAGKFNTTNNVSFKGELIPEELPVYEKRSDNTYYHNSTYKDIDLIFEFSSNVWCDGFQYLYDNIYGISSCIDQVEVYSCSSYFSGNIPDDQWILEEIPSKNVYYGFNKPETNENKYNFQYINKSESNSTISQDSTLVTFKNSFIKWVPRNTCRYIKIRVKSSKDINFTTSNIFTVKSFSLKISNNIQNNLNTSVKRRISMNFTNYFSQQTFIANTTSYGVENVNNWNNIIPFLNPGVVDNENTIYSITDNLGQYIGDSLWIANYVKTRKELVTKFEYYQHGYIYNVSTDGHAFIHITVPDEFVTSTYHIYIYTGIIEETQQLGQGDDTRQSFSITLGTQDPILRNIDKVAWPLNASGSVNGFLGTATTVHANHYPEDFNYIIIRDTNVKYFQIQPLTDSVTSRISAIQIIQN